MQLVAYGAFNIQDIYLTGNPQHYTFTKVSFTKDKSNLLTTTLTLLLRIYFANFKWFCRNAVAFGKKVSCTISRNGDLVHRTYCKNDWCDYIYKDNSQVMDLIDI